MEQLTLSLAWIKQCAWNSFTVRDNSPRGLKTVSKSQVKVGDYVVWNNCFHLVVA